MTKKRRNDSVAKSDEDIFPKTPFERCHLRWHWLFWGVWEAVCKYDKKLRLGLPEALKKYGLNVEGGVPEQFLFKENPSDDILAKAKAFYENPKIPNIKWQRPPWEKPDVYFFFVHYSSILFELNELPPNFFNLRNPEYRKMILKQKLPLILKHIPFASEMVSNIDDRNVAKWAKLSKKDLAVNLVAHVYEWSVPNARKNLALARKKYPKEATWWKHGLQMIWSK